MTVVGGKALFGCMMSFMLKREPVAAGFVGFDALVFAVLGFLQVFGWLELSAEQNAAVVSLVAVVSAVVASFVRSKVVPSVTFDAFKVEAADYADEAYVAGFDLGLFTPVPSDPAVIERFSGAEGS